VPLPFSTVLPFRLRTLLRNLPPEEREKVGYQEEFDFAAGLLCEEDPKLFRQLLDEWITKDDGSDPDVTNALDLVRLELASLSFRELFGELMVATIETGSMSMLDGEEEVVFGDDLAHDEIDPALLERHGDFLLAQGYPQLARRSWMLCAELGPLPDSVRDKIEQVNGETSG